MRRRPFAMAALSGLVAGCAVSHPMYDAGIDVGCRDQQSATTVGSPNGEAGHGLTWIRSGERRDKALGSAWCETVGSAVITLVPGYPYSPLSDDTLAVGSWNTRVGGADFFEFLDSEFGLTCGDSGPTGGRHSGSIRAHAPGGLPPFGPTSARGQEHGDPMDRRPRGTPRGGARYR